MVKNIEKDYEERIKEAIDNLKDINSNNIKDSKKIELKHINLKKGNKVTNPKPIFLKIILILSIMKIMIQT